MAAQWQNILNQIDTARKAAEEIEQHITELTGKVAQVTAEQAAATTALPVLRMAEAEAGAALARLMAARDQLDSEASRLATAHRDIEIRLQQTVSDRDREMSRVGGCRAGALSFG